MLFEFCMLWSGWGTNSSGGVLSNVLLEVDVQVVLSLCYFAQKWQIWSGAQVVSNSECNSAYNEVITSNMLCAGDASGNGGSDACQVKMIFIER